MRKEHLEELKGYLEELKTISKRNVSKEESFGDRIVLKDGVKYISLDDIEKGQFVTTEKYVCTLNNGEEIFREKIKKAKKDGSAVVIIPVTDKNEVIVTVEPRVFTESTVGIGFPAGYIEDGEEPYVAALRELQEEVGCVPKYLIELARYYQDEGISAAKNVAYLALGCTEGHEKNPDPGEFIRYAKCGFKEVIELQEAGLIEGANPIIAIEKSKPYFNSRGKVKKIKLKFDKNKIEI